MKFDPRLLIRPLASLSILAALAISAAATSFSARSVQARTEGHLTGRSYAESLAGLRTGHVSERQRLLNSTILNAHLSKGEQLHLHAGTLIEIGKTLRIGSGGALLGERGANKATIYMPASAFDNRRDPEGRYGANAVGIDFSGELAGPLRPSVSVRIENIRLLSEQQQGRWLHAIVGRNVTKCVLRDIEISGFPTAIGLALASARACHVTGAYIHDFSDDTKWATLPQSTGIEIDNDLVNGIPSTEIMIDHFRIERVRVGGALLAKWGYQTDGINVLSSAKRVDISDGHISDVGEGIDTFGLDGTIRHVTITNTYNFGLKFIHGAARNHVTDVTITNAGLAGVIFAGSDQASRDTAGNIIRGIKISNIDPAGNWRAHSTAAIMISGRNTRRVPAENRIIGAEINLGANGKYGWLDQSTGRDNRGDNIRMKSGRSLDRPVLILYRGSSVDRQ